MKVLSLFDGMSCGRIALDQLGIPVDTYYASEIDKYAMQVSQANYPEIIQVGDICDLDPNDYMDVDLVLAGSPCQGFSFAGKQLAFDDPRSALFFEFIRLLKAIKPKYFLLENVRMKKEFLQVISEQVSECYPEIPFGIEPIFINSSLLSAQSRQRYYWTNIPGVKQPEDKGIVLRDILEDDYGSERDKAHCIDANYYKGANVEQYKTKHRRQLVNKHKPVKDTPRNRRHVRQPDEKSLCMTATMYKGAGNNGMTLVPNKPIKVGMNVEQVKIRKHEVDIESLQYVLREMKKESGKTNKQIATETELPVTKVEHWFRTDSSFAIPGDDIWPKLKEVLGIKSEVFDKSIMEFEYRDGVFESTQRVYSEEGKSPTLTASNKEQMIETKPKQVGVAVDVNGYDCLKRVYSPEGKSPTVTTCQGGNTEPKVVTGGAIRGRAYDKDGKRMDKDGVSVANKTTQMLELRKDDKSNAITTVGKDSVAVNEDLTWRKLTPLECERLQTVPDNYTNHVSNTQRYKMLGNGWTVEVIKHIFNNMEY
jgi:DNA-cytosine methyltransferase